MFWIDEINNKAQKVLEEYIQEFNGGNPLIPPIPIEVIIDLKYGINVMPMQNAKDRQEYSGFYNRNGKTIEINRDEYHPRQLFTLGHELGHHLLNHPCTEGLFRDKKGDVKEDIREKPKKDIEREADIFSSEIIMPSVLVISLFQNKLKASEVIPGNTWDDFINSFKMDKLELISKEVVPTISKLANDFGVSNLAMRYKLINLRLIPGDVQRIIGFAKLS